MKRPEGLVIATELRERIHRLEKEFTNSTYVKDGWLIIHVPPRWKSTYDIELNRINSYRDMLDWTRQLGEKPWMDKDRLLRILALIAHHRNLPF